MEHVHTRHRRVALVACVTLVAGVLPLAAQTGAQHQDRYWYASAGVSRAQVDPVAADFSMAGDTPTLTPSGITLPHLAVGRRTGRVAIEAGYRKLGVLRFASPGGQVEGNTHSNALALNLRLTLSEWARVRVDAGLGAQVVRTIATLRASPPDWPIAGGIDTWRLAPLTSLGVAVRLNRHWSVGFDYVPIIGRLGTAGESGRYGQQIIGLDVGREWR